MVYHELILTSKEYMTQVTAIDAYWLGECTDTRPLNPFLILPKPSLDLYFTRSRRRISTTGVNGDKLIVNSPNVQSWRPRWPDKEKKWQGSAKKMRWPRNRLLVVGQRSRSLVRHDTPELGLVQELRKRHVDGLAYRGETRCMYSKYS